MTLVMQNALEKYGIRVNDILPGNVRTPLKVAQVERMRDATGDEESFKRNMDALVLPDDVARIVAFMASDEAKVLRGSVGTA